jgi:hypothetical protein
VAAALLVILVFGGGWLYLALDPAYGRYGLLGLYFPAGRGPSWWGGAVDLGLNPLRAWWFLGYVGAPGSGPASVEHWQHELEVRVPALAGGTAALALAAGVLWLDALRRFRAYRAR